MQLLAELGQFDHFNSKIRWRMRKTDQLHSPTPPEVIREYNPRSSTR